MFRVITNKVKTRRYLFSAVYVRNILRTAYAQFFSPPVCICCGNETGTAISLCADCGEKFFASYINMHRTEPNCFCKVCGKALISEIAVCQRCKSGFIHATISTGKFDREQHSVKKTELFFEKNFALFPYIGDGQKIVSDWKNKGMRNYAQVFAEHLLQFLHDDSELSGLSIVPVPPRPAKLKTKGWDQIADIASELRACGKTILPILRRRDGVSQKHVSKTERSENLVGKFYLHRSVKSEIPESVILLDDIITTGATINECSKVLREAGCKKVYGLCLFFDA
ncbi:MAG: ComF family protein [Treponemataceae bacterium]